MLRTADTLLAALDPLPHPHRLRRLALTVPDLAERGTLTAVLDDLDGRGAYERRLAALAALAGRQEHFLAARLADPDPVVAGYALRGARTLPLPDAAIETAYEDASAATRDRIARFLWAGDRPGLTERLVTRLRAQGDVTEAARLLPGCSGPFVTTALPGLAHAVTSPVRLARRHPGPFLDQAERDLAERPPGVERTDWWQRHAGALAVVTATHPERVLTLLERHGPGTLPDCLRRSAAALVAADAERFVRWLVAPERDHPRYEPHLPSGAFRALVRADPPSLPLLGRHWLRSAPHLTALVKAVPPGRRAAFLDEVTAADEPGRAPLGDLALLPRERRWAEVRGSLAEPDAEQMFWLDLLDTRAHGPFDEARPHLLAALDRPDAGDRAAVWPLLVACAGRDGGRAAVAEVLELMTRRLRNERDPVRADALGALAGLNPARFAAEDIGPLDRILLDALGARDASAATRDALRRLAAGLLVAHGTGEGAQPALPQWALHALERITGHMGDRDFGPLHRTLRRGQEHRLFEVLRPWLEAAHEKADHRLLFAFTTALGRRAHRMSALQRMLEDALGTADDEEFRTAVRLWLEPPATRDERVARVLEREPSAAALPPVLEALAARRTDLLDTLLGDRPPYGRFLPPGADRPLPGPRHGDRLLPRQQEAVVRVARAVVTDASRPLPERAAALHAVAGLPAGHRLALDQLGAPDVLLAEAALAALPRAGRPAEVLGTLLGHAGGDRARVAVYAAGHAARSVAPSELARQLEDVLLRQPGAKVTSRKEAVRLAARLLPAPRAAALLAAAYRIPDQHPDVRAAVVASAVPLVGAPDLRAVLDDASRGLPRVQRALLMPNPWHLAAEHRPRYARLVAEVCSTTDPEVREEALDRLAAWAPYAPEAATVLGRTVTDLDVRVGWREAARALGSLAISGAPHPVGGAAPGSLFHDTIADLLTAVRRAEYDARPDRDRPASQRLRWLLLRLPHRVDPGTVPVLEAVADQLADEPSVAEHRAGLLRSLILPDQELGVLRARLSALADALRGRPGLACRTAEYLERQVAGATPPDPAAVLAAARHTAAADGVPGGLLAVALVAAQGRRLGWPEEWRVLLRELRRHEDGDVRAAALEAVVHYE
ncbi:MULTISPECIES: hypothetical protein [Streptomyces]|uniref:hypothetical protein n=1 Tax=Streptomyces TaxID=1883 RepID=UPI00163C0497|nr:MULTISPECIES: hypothetical protein [Streptomyces]MBC2876537.1 hypothetical protein [Streptomyces sp. TYQ1024]UBI40790.1 hypothetical protein K7I03_32870 [Streptomyces mobaraensis]